MNYINNPKSLVLHFDDTSRKVDRRLHRNLKKRFLIIESAFYHFLVDKGGLHLKPSLLPQMEMYLTLCGERRIRRLNRDYRGKDKVTDVLSFPLYDSFRCKKIGPFLAPVLEFGDVVICLPVAYRQAKEFDISVEDEITHQLVHGFLHLLGFDHELSQREEKIMEKYEKQLVENISQLTVKA